MAGDTYATTNVPDNVKALLDAGRSMGSPYDDHEGKPVVIVPTGYKVETLNVPPQRVPRAVSFTDGPSFCEYVQKYKTPGTLLFAVVADAGCTITAHLDYHDKPVLEANAREINWSSHTAKMECKLTNEWQTWLGHNGADKAFSQIEFAQFLEDNDRLFIAPTGAEFLELVTTLEGKNHVRFNSGIRLQNGKSKLDFEEDVELRGGGAPGQTSGSIEIPEKLHLGIIPFENGPQPYNVYARLRYRISSRQLVFWYETITPHLILREAAQAVLDLVREKAGAPVLIGG